MEALGVYRPPSSVVFAVQSVSLPRKAPRRAAKPAFDWPQAPQGSVITGACQVDAAKQTPAACLAHMQYQALSGPQV